MHLLFACSGHLEFFGKYITELITEKVWILGDVNTQYSILLASHAAKEYLKTRNLKNLAQKHWTNELFVSGSHFLMSYHN